MTDTLTLEELRGELDASPYFRPGRSWRDALDAAIRERDKLRRGLSEMRELAADFERDRDKAEAELAALKKRVAEAPQVAVRHATYLHQARGPRDITHVIEFPKSWIGKRVRLLVDGDA